jgi:peptide/nickel transport system substrate-binding protein
MKRTTTMGLRATLTAAAAIAVAVPTFLAAGPASAETIKVGLREFPAGRGNPFQGCVCSPAVFVWSATYEQLSRVGLDGRAVPELAASWENINPTTWRIKLKPGIKFSNGEPMNADAVKATFDFLATDRGKTFSQSKTLGVFLASTEVVDDLTVDVKTPKPDPLLPKLVSSQSIIPPKAFADQSVEGFTNSPIGSGPYIVKWSDAGSKATATPYAGSRLARKDVDRIEFVVLEEAPARTQALLSGQVDVNISLGPDEHAAVEAAGMKIFSAPSTRTMGLTLITHRSGKTVTGPLADKRVRQALNYAVDKQSIIDNIFSGSGTPASQAAVPTAFGYNKSVKAYPYDPEKAKALLAEAGYATGLELEFRAITSSADFRFSYEAAVQDLNRIGIKATLISQQFAGGDGWLEHWLKGDWPYDGFGFGNDLTGHLDAGLSFARHSSCTKPAPYYCDEGEMALINSGYTEFDVNKREKIWQEALKINAENAPIIYLIEFNESMGFNSRIKNFHNVNLWIPYNDLEIGS